ncbi:O-antigen ligase family protein [Stieleria sp. TO1_6]|uniref:O-antigen ligase family protein n=1 Tax=Stieleria tagensis TaxID=2956795 RepID=UPI00209ABDD1|nr:O-antigen ligase family protein [Stieleria tagensis]MCO8123440.1 O-antigen ligase family protein [Stieleria tagensis]
MLMLLGILAVVLGGLAIATSFDFGGQLAWTQYCLALGIVGVSAATWLVLVAGRFRVSQRGEHHDTAASSVKFPRYTLLWLMSLWCGYIYFQSIDLPSDWVRWLSPGSAAAYTEWLEPIRQLAGTPQSDSHPISIDVARTRHGLAFLICLLPVIWVGAEISRGARVVRALLATISIGAGIHAAYGMLCLLQPELSYTNTDDVQRGFGGFINPNNAALFMNLGIAASLGLLTWQVVSIGGRETAFSKIVPSDVLDALCETRSWPILSALFLNLAGVACCGSRGGLCAMVIGLLAVVATRFKWRKQRTFFIIAIVPPIIWLTLFLAQWRENSGAESIVEVDPRISVRDVSGDTRIGHWQDGWEASRNYFPAGSGAGTYRHAYLPYQDHGGRNWFHHADNLWLEILVEQGILGSILAIAVASLTMISTIRLQRSADCLDNAISITTTYLIIVIGLSQLVDFGLLLPGTAVLVVLLISIATVRSKSNFPDSRFCFKKSAFAYIFQQSKLPVRTVLGAVVILLAVSQLPYLLESAKSEAVARRCSLEYGKYKNDLASLDRIVAKILRQSESLPTGELLVQQFKYQFQSARLNEISELKPKSKDELQILLAQTRLGNRASNQLSDSSRKNYQSAFVTAIRNTFFSPFSLQGRSELIALQFQHQDKSSLVQLIAQLGKLQCRNPEQLVRLAEIAEKEDELVLASELLRRLNELNPNYTGYSVEFASRNYSADLTFLVPLNRRNQVRAAKHILDHQDQRAVLAGRADAFLEQSIRHFHCNECSTNLENSDCEFLTAKVLFDLGKDSDALKHLKQSIELTPADAAKRVIYVTKLVEAGDLEAAILEAQKAKNELPADPRFEQLLARIARIEQQGNQ